MQCSVIEHSLISLSFQTAVQFETAMKNEANLSSFVWFGNDLKPCSVIEQSLCFEVVFLCFNCFKPGLHIVVRIVEHACDDASKRIFKVLNILIANIFHEISILTIITVIETKP